MKGLKGVQHVSSTVRDLEETLAWYRDVLSIEPFMRMDAAGEELSAGLGVPGAELDVAFLDVGGTWVELIEYRRRHETLVERVVETRMPTDFGEFRAVGYRSLVDGVEHVALTVGDVSSNGGEDVLVIVGGVIPPQDHDALFAAGASAVFVPGTKIPDAAAEIIRLLKARRTKA